MSYAAARARKPGQSVSVIQRLHDSSSHIDQPPRSAIRNAAAASRMTTAADQIRAEVAVDEERAAIGRDESSSTPPASAAAACRPPENCGKRPDMPTAASTPPPDAAVSAWWETRRAFVAFVALAALPLIWPDVPPLIDLPGHMGRYRIQLDLADSPALQRFYAFQWSLIGNLGVDLLVIPLSKLFGLELAVKLIVTSVPMLTVAGFLAVAREVHGRVPPTALFALPLAYNFPLMFGFVNFALSMGLAFLAFALWLRLGRQGRFGLRAAIFVPLSLLLWVIHAFGWGTLGLMVFGAELLRADRRGRSLAVAGLTAVRACLVLTPPIMLMLLWRSGEAGGETGKWFDYIGKWRWLLQALRDRWPIFDFVAIVVVLLVIAAGARTRAFGMARGMVGPVLALLVAFVLLPFILFGSAFTDMRLAPYLLAAALLAIKPPTRENLRLARVAAYAGLAFLLVRTAGTTASFWLFDRSFDRELAALDHVPRGARLVSFVGVWCGSQEWSRLDHLPAMAIVRREAFSNDQWEMAGAQLLRVTYPAGGGYVSDPSQLVTPQTCTGTLWKKVNDALAGLPRGAFDYVWLIDPPAYEAELTRGLTPVWRSGSSVLFRVDRQDRK